MTRCVEGGGTGRASVTTEQREAVRRWPARLTSSVRGRATVITVGVSAVILLLLFTLLLLLVRDFTLNKDRRTSERTVERVVDDLRPGDPDQKIGRAHV